MKNLKKIIALGLATTAVVSAMSMTALAKYDDTAYTSSLPTLSEVDTSKASRETPVKYIDEKTGTIVTIYDPDITVEFPSVLSNTKSSVVAEGTIYVPRTSSDRFGNATDPFEASEDGVVYFTLTLFKHDKYNVSLNKEGTDAPLVVVENKDTDVPITLKGVKNGSSYEFRVSSYMGAGNAAYVATM